MSTPLYVKLVSVRKLRPNKRNPRTHSNKQVRQLAKNITRFGWTQPILIDECGIILAGHGRYQAALLLGLREVPVIVISGLSETERRALALADNKLAANAGWDRKLLAEELGQLANLLPEFNLDLEITGFEAPEIATLLGDFAGPEADPGDRARSPQKKTISKAGDVWRLGPHRLSCGKARSLADVDAAVRRWQTFAKRDAILESTGQRFDGTAVLRSKIGGAR
jgi:ParB-like chromosome segregation protein Spo0J